MIIRLIGSFLLVLGVGAAERLHHIAAMLPQQDPTLTELALSLAVALCGSFGALLLIAGPALFRPCGTVPSDD